MKTLLRYLVNTILFVVIWCIPAFLFVGYSVSVNGTRPSGIAAIGGIIAIIISYRVVKRINKSNLWASLFDETEEVEKEVKASDVVEKKVEVKEEKIEKKVEVEDSNIFNPKNITIGILAIVLISFLYFQFGGTLEDTKDYNITEQTEYNVDDEILLLEKKFSKAQEDYFLLYKYRGGEPDDPKSEVNSWCEDALGNMVDCYSDKLIKQSDPDEPFILTLKSSNQPVTGIVHSNPNYKGNYSEYAYKNGLLHGYGFHRRYDGTIQHMWLYENGETIMRKYFDNDDSDNNYVAYYKNRKQFYSTYKR